MTIEKLNGEITRLKNKLTSIELERDELRHEATQLEYELERIEQKRDRLMEGLSEPIFERMVGKTYYFIYEDCARFGIYASTDQGSNSALLNYELDRYNENNYFHSATRAREVLEKFKMLLKLERLHDTYCPDYVPDWNSGDWKYSVFYHNTVERYEVEGAAAFEDKIKVYFPTKEIAQKVCDILNAEQERDCESEEEF